MRIHHKKILYCSAIIGSLSLASDASCEIKTFPVSFADEINLSAPQSGVEKIKNDATSFFSGKTTANDRANPLSTSKQPDGASLADLRHHQATTHKKSSVSDNITAPVATEKYNIREVMLLALQWHPKIKRAKYEVERLKSVVDEANSAYYPNVDMGLRSGMEKDSYTANHNKENHLNLSLEQMLYDFGNTGDRVDLSELYVINSSYDVKKEINDILYETIGAYLQIVRHNQLLSVMQNRINGFIEIKEMTKKRVALGASAESDYSQASLRVAEAIANHSDYVAQKNKWSATLDKLTNQSISSAIMMSFPGELAEYYKEWSRNGIPEIDSPAIKIAQSKLDIAKKQIDIEKNGHFPKITLNPYYEYDLATSTSGNSGINKSRDRYGVFFNVKVPLYQGGAVSSKVQQATEAFHAAQYNLDAEKYNAERKVMEFSSQIISTNMSLQSMLEKERSAIRTRALYMSQYLNLGSRSISDLITAESEIHQTKLDIINNRYTVANISLESLYYAGELINLLHTKGLLSESQ